MALGMIKNPEIPKYMIFSDFLSSLIAIQEGNQNHPHIQEIQEKYQYLTDYGKIVVLAWVPSHEGIRGNQMADPFAKEATKMITTVKFPFTDYKTKMKNYIRKWQAIWDMFPNNKLYKHQPKIKLEITEPLPNRRQEIVLSRIRIGHIYLTHAYLLKEEMAPWWTCCNQLLIVSRILIDCKKYKNISKKSYHATTLALLFKDIPASQV